MVQDYCLVGRKINLLLKAMCVNHLLTFSTIKISLLCFSDYVNNTHSIEKYSHNAKKYEEESRDHLNVSTLRWLPLTFGDLYSQETFMHIGTEVSSANSYKSHYNAFY